MKKKQYIVAKVKVLKDAGKISVVASDETLDRHGDVLPIQNWDLTKFMLSPRMLVDHNHEVSSIVGKWDNTRIENNQLVMDANFHGITPLSVAVEKMVNQDYLDTVSVGFIYHGPTEDGGQGSMELIETSWVTVPANPSARVMKSALQESDTEDFKTAVAKFLGKDLVEGADEDDIDAPDDEDDKDDDEKPDAGKEDEDEELSLGTVITNASQFKQLPVDTEKIECSYDFVLNLIADSEKLKTLTETDKQAMVEALKSAEVMRLAMKHAAHIVNQTLQRLNKGK